MKGLIILLVLTFLSPGDSFGKNGKSFIFHIVRILVKRSLDGSFETFDV